MRQNILSVLVLVCIGVVQVFGDISKYVVNPIVNDQFVAEILNLDLEHVTDEDFTFIEEQLLRYKVLAIRNQKDLTVEGQRHFSQRFGTLHVHLESASHYEGYPDVNLVSNIKNADGKYIGLYGKHVEEFHSDLSWAPLPCKITILKSEIRPANCGATDFLDTVSAYNALTEEQQYHYRDILGKYCYLNHKNVSGGGTDNLRPEEIAAARECAIHPLITQHPQTQQYNIYANPSHTSSILLHSSKPTPGEVADAAKDLQALFAHTAQFDLFGYRHHWAEHDVVIWDNRAVHHRATGCPDEQPRKLIRTTVNNDAVPVGDIMYEESNKHVWGSRLYDEL
jgi:taurine dioxygenase